MASKMTKRTAKNGKTTWTCLVDVPADPVTGKRRQKRLSAPTRKELETLVTKTMRELQTGAYIETSSATTGEYLAQWIDAAAGTVRPATEHTYRTIIANRITPHLGGVPLAKLNALHLQSYYGARQAKGDSPSTIRLDHAILRRALRQAVKWRLIAVNPCDDATPPRPRRVELTTWTAEQARAFLAGTAEDTLAALWRLALATGMRRGELLALQWRDVNLARGVLAVTRTMTQASDGHWTTGDPKSAAGRRSIALDSATLAALKRHKAHQNERRLEWGEAWQDTGVVFDRGDGATINPNYLNKRFAIFTKRLGLPVIRLHDLRHTAATLMMSQGAHPKIVSERLGHSTIAMTLDRYSHVTLDMQREAADRHGDALSG